MRFTLRQLEVFLAVANLGHLTRAAEQLSMSQSAASSALKELEQQYDMLLFDRIGKRLQLNEQGRLVRPRAEALLAQAAEFEQTLDQHAEAGPLNVGATLSIGNYLAVHFMAEYMRRYPDSPITLDVENTEHIAEKVVNYQLDIGLIEGELNHPNLEMIPWRQDQLAIFCSAQHPYAQLNRPLTDQELIQAEWILREQGSGTRQTFDRSMQGILPKLNISLELQHTEAIKRAVEANLGIGCLSMITLADALQRGNLIRLQVANRDLSRQLYLILHKQKYRSNAAQAWIKLCQQYNKDSKES